MELFLARPAYQKYAFDLNLFDSSKPDSFTSKLAMRQFVAHINDIRKTSKPPQEPMQAGELNALVLIQQAFHIILEHYFEHNGLQIRNNLIATLMSGLAPARYQQTLLEYVQQFPPLEVLQNISSPYTWLIQPGQEVRLMDEVLINWLHNQNPAAEQFFELFDRSNLSEKTAYDQMLDGMQFFFQKQPGIGPENKDLISFLREPALLSPRSFLEQLEYIRSHWGFILGDFIRQILGGMDVLREEQKASFLGPGPSFVPVYPGQSRDGQEAQDAFAGLDEVERFSPDSDWMPRVVMIAKNAYVWLNQLSRQYGRQIDRLDQVPDETLAQLAEAGFSGLWLIGLWERSTASQRIKQLCGNPDAVASAYSLRRYQIAERLGGEAAWYDLSRRCSHYGIRLASDMVPNHMGIDSDWVFEHPEWFVGQEHSPFPVYQFNGPDLSEHSDISLNIDDHYYDRSDAAVVFKLHNQKTGKDRYIYHGNDGTSMPWNDTAQLNYLLPEVREAVIQTILDVARKFSIIRFDAAMTLTKKHYQRLWFPQPGSGGDIPSRSDHALTKEEFDQAMPEEFWREVVERVAKEVPDTLLLAEAFWLMEGYFVRTLGMHRVYNSAFMNMMRDEENAKYRLLIKNTLTYDPEILKRYVNFMNNPDEKTAVEQFGKGDKYFGICTVMSTMPGLPMFGHGQIEGYTEKYGMEYYRPYWDETPDWGLVEHHRKVIFPLLHRRRIFANVENFRLYDLRTPSGAVNENLFAYSNYADGQAGLVIYHNHYGETSGWIKTSVPYLVKYDDDSALHTQDLADALFLEGSSWAYVLFKDSITGLTHLLSLDDLRTKGMYVHAGPYEHHVYSGFKIVEGEEYAAIYQYLKGSGVSDLEYLRLNLRYAPLADALTQVLDLAISTPDPDKSAKTSESSSESAVLSQFRQAVQQTYGLELPEIPCSQDCWRNTLEDLEGFITTNNLEAYPSVEVFINTLRSGIKADPRSVDLLKTAAILAQVSASNAVPNQIEAFLETLSLTPLRDRLRSALTNIGYSEYEASRGLLALNWLLKLRTTPASLVSDAASLLESWLASPEFASYIEVNEYQQVLWFNKEKFAQALWLYQLWQLIGISCESLTEASIVQRVAALARSTAALEKAAPASDYQLKKLRELVNAS